MPKEFTLPDLGEGIAEAQVIRMLIKEGEQVKEDQYLMEVETDKAAVEIPSPYGGVATKVHVKEGQTVNVGDVIVTFDDGAGGAESAAVAPAKTAHAPSPSVAQEAASEPIESRGSASVAVAQAPPASPPRKTTAPAAPAVRKRARELGVDLDQVVGRGPGGRITKEDVERYAAGDGASAPVSDAPVAPAPQAQPRPGVADTDKWGPIRREPLNQIRKTIANHMHRSAFTAVHVTHSDVADITRLDRMRRRLNEATNNDPKLTLMSFLVRASCLTLRRFPVFNASFDEEGGQIIYKDYVNMGIAVDTQRGLIVPVIRHADRLSLCGIATELRSIADRIRTNRFAIEDLRGGTFTITNVGALGGTFNTPIINYPEVAILGLGRSRRVPVVQGEDIVVALQLPINLSFDHRLIDGADAARFTSEMISYLETPERFLLD